MIIIGPILMTPYSEGDIKEKYQRLVHLFESPNGELVIVHSNSYKFQEPIIQEILNYEYQKNKIFQRIKDTYGTANASAIAHIYASALQAENFMNKTTLSGLYKIDVTPYHQSVLEKMSTGELKDLLIEFLEDNREVQHGVIDYFLGIKSYNSALDYEDYLSRKIADILRQRRFSLDEDLVSRKITEILRDILRQRGSSNSEAETSEWSSIPEALSEFPKELVNKNPLLQQKDKAQLTEDDIAEREGALKRPGLDEDKIEIPTDKIGILGFNHMTRSEATKAKKFKVPTNVGEARNFLSRNNNTLPPGIIVTSGQDALNDPTSANSLPAENGVINSDKAQLTPGGIDFNPAIMNTSVNKEGRGVIIPVSDLSIEDINVEGFVPIIINVMPVVNLPFLLGLDTNVDSPENQSAKGDRFNLTQLSPVYREE